MKKQNNSSKSLTLNKTDWKKIGTGALIAITGAILTYVTDTLPNVDLGEYAPIVMTVWTVIANITRKYLSGE